MGAAVIAAAVERKQKELMAVMVRSNSLMER